MNNNKQNHSKTDKQVLDIFVKFGYIFCIFPWSSNKKVSCNSVIYVFISSLGFTAITSQLSIHYSSTNGALHKLLISSIVTLIISFNIALVYGHIFKKKLLLKFLKIIENVDYVMGTTGFSFKNNILLIILLLYFGMFFLAYASNVVLSTTTISVQLLVSFYFAMTIFQSFYITIIGWYILSCLKRRYDRLNDIIKTMHFDGISTVWRTERMDRTKRFKALYLSLNSSVKLFNDIFGNVILLLFLLGFTYFLIILNGLIILKTSLSWDIILFFSGMTLYLVSIYFNKYKILLSDLIL